MNTAEREAVLKSLIDTIEGKLAEANNGKRANFVLVILDGNEDASIRLREASSMNG